MSVPENAIAEGRACCVCGSPDARFWRRAPDRLLGGTEQFTAVRCRICGTARLQPRPSAEEMARYYAPTTYARAEGGAQDSELGKRLDALFGQQAARADALIPAAPGVTRHLLDVGCGDGRFLAAMQARGWQCEGLETDPVAADLARRRAGVVIHEATLEAAPVVEKQFDLVSLLHVIEHVPDPRATLRAIRRVLRPGGALLLALPNAGSLEAALFRSCWYQLDLPRHFWGFTPSSLTQLVEEPGFTVRSRHYLPFLFAPQSLRNVFRALRGRAAGTPAPEAAGVRTESRAQTRLFLSLLQISERLGHLFPGEVMELTAVRKEYGDVPSSAGSEALGFPSETDSGDAEGLRILRRRFRRKPKRRASSGGWNIPVPEGDAAR